MAITWAAASSTTLTKRATAVCTTGTEAAPSAATDGLSLKRCVGLSIHLEAAGAMTAGTLDCYLYNPISGNWNKADPNSMLSQTVSAGATRASFAGLSIDASDTRIAFVPNGLGQGSTVYLNATVK